MQLVARSQFALVVCVIMSLITVAVMSGLLCRSCSCCFCNQKKHVLPNHWWAKVN